MLIRFLLRNLGILGLAVACAQATVARDNVWKPAQDNATWRTECGACHLAFPPALLSVDDWLDLMSNLDKHFGVDASLEPQTKAEISNYLKQQGTSNRLFASRDAVPRITTSERFVGKHRSAIRLWQKGQIKSLADCESCHKEAGTKD
jgi:hypothetical protein